jgi:MFS family permease
MIATTIALGTSPMSEIEHQSALRRAVIASTVGTTIEWYDFLIYSTVTGLVFNKVYFPGSDPWVGTLQAFGVYFVGFVARPIGAAIFGHYGDRIGRKATLIVTLLMTGIATAAVGLVPGYDQIGIWGAVILVILRLIQGIGVGGEWGGSVLLAMEWAQTKEPGLHYLMATIRRAARAVPGQRRGAVLQLVLRRSVPELGLAHPIPHQHYHGGRRVVDSSRYP